MNLLNAEDKHISMAVSVRGEMSVEFACLVNIGWVGLQCLDSLNVLPSPVHQRLDCLANILLLAYQAVDHI